MDLTIKSAAGPMRTVAPTPSYFVDFTEGGSVARVGFVQASSGGQPDFLPLPRLFVGARSRGHRAQHTPVGLGNDIGLAPRSQTAEGFLILRPRDLFCPAGMVERGISHGADVHLKTVVFQHSRRSVMEGMFDAKIG